MKLLSAVFLATLLCVGLAHASITPLLDSTTTSGPDTTYNYEISVDNNETLDPIGCTAGKLDGSCTWFTISITDYVPGSIATTVPGWTAEPVVAGILTFVYSGPDVTGTGVEIPGFSAESTLSSQVSQEFVYQTGNVGGGVDDGFGTVGTATPEPTSISLFGGALIGLAILGRRKFARS